MAAGTQEIQHIPKLELEGGYYLKEVQEEDQARLLEIANTEGFVFSMLNARVDETTKERLSTETSVQRYLDESCLGPQLELPENSDIRAEYIGGLYNSQDELIGAAELFEVKKDEATGKVNGEVGYFLDPAYQGQGLAIRAVTRMLQWARGDLKGVGGQKMQGIGLSELQAKVDPANEASMKVLKKLGFDPEHPEHPAKELKDVGFTDAEGNIRPRLFMTVDEETFKDALQKLVTQQKGIKPRERGSEEMRR